MLNLAHLADTLQAVLTTFANQAAFATGFRCRHSQLDGANLAQTLTFGWLANPTASRGELAQQAAVTKQALDQSLTAQAADCLKAVLERAVSQALQADAADWPVLNRFAAVYLLDSSTINLPPQLAEVWQGCGKEGTLSQAGLKLHVGLEVRSGKLLGPSLTSARTHDRAGPHQDQELGSGVLRLTDLGYFKLSRLREMQQQGTYWLSRVLSSAVMYDEGGRKWRVSEWLAGQKQEKLDCTIRLGSRGQLKCRLLAQRLAAEVIEQRQVSMRNVARKRQRASSAAQVELSQWSVYVTNLSCEQVSLAEARVLYRWRWQIELLFKLWKSGGGQLEQWGSAKPWAILCEVYAKLMGLVVQHWLILASVWGEDERSLVKASRVIRQFARSLRVRMGELTALLAELDYLVASLQGRCGLDRHTAKPNSFQLLAALSP